MMNRERNRNRTSLWMGWGDDWWHNDKRRARRSVRRIEKREWRKEWLRQG